MRLYTGKEYLQIDMANNFGLDKFQFGGRLKWVQDNETQLEALVEQAKEPFRFAAALMAYRKTQAGQPTGYLVGFDACASGPQIMSTWVGCKVGARNTGLTGQTRMDIYKETVKAMDKILGKNSNYNRDAVKISLMTHYYGSKAEPKNAFGEDTPELEAFYEAQKIVAPGASELMHHLLNAWQPFALQHTWIMPDGFFVNKKVKDMVDDKIEVDELEGHPCFIYRHTENVGLEEGISLAADCVHSGDGFIVREMNYRCNYDRTALKRAERMLHYRLFQGIPAIGATSKIERLADQHQFISLAGAHNLTQERVNSYSYEYAYNLLKLVRQTLAKPAFPIVFIHDDFKCHANNMNIVRQTYNDIFAEMANSNMINAILTMITGKPTNITKLSDDLSVEIRSSEYFLS